MKALLLSAGLGTRLLPLTRDVPKCLVEVRGEVLLGRWLRILKEMDVEQVVVNTHYLSDRVESFIRPQIDEGWVIARHENELLGTAATIWTNRQLLSSEETLVIHADNFLSGDLQDFVTAHRTRPSHCLMSMLTIPCSDPSEMGTVRLDQESVVIEFREKDQSSPFQVGNAAVYLLSEEAVRLTEGLKDFSTEALPRFIGRIFAHAFKGTVIDIGTLPRLRLVNSIK